LPVSNSALRNPRVFRVRVPRRAQIALGRPVFNREIPGRRRRSRRASVPFCGSIPGLCAAGEDRAGRPKAAGVVQATCPDPHPLRPGGARSEQGRAAVAAELAPREAAAVGAALVHGGSAAQEAEGAAGDHQRGRVGRSARPLAIAAMAGDHRQRLRCAFVADRPAGAAARDLHARSGGRGPACSELWKFTLIRGPTALVDFGTECT